MGQFKYFTDAEVAGLQDNLPAMLDMARGLMDIRIPDARVILTFTTGGQHCGHSAHYKGLAVDIGTGHLSAGFDRDSYSWALTKSLLLAGFERIEICPSHIHADIGKPPDYPAPVLILGQEA